MTPPRLPNKEERPLKKPNDNFLPNSPMSSPPRPDIMMVKPAPKFKPKKVD